MHIAAGIRNFREPKKSRLEGIDMMMCSDVKMDSPGQPCEASETNIAAASVGLKFVRWCKRHAALRALFVRCAAV
jgi:hypothetical protein